MASSLTKSALCCRKSIYVSALYLTKFISNAKYLFFYKKITKSAMRAVRLSRKLR